MNIKHTLNRTRILAPLAVALALTFAATGWAEVKLAKPGLVTTIGQSSDIAVVKALLNTKLKLGLEVKPTAQASDLDGMKTLVVVLGASTKGLGAAGINLDQEKERAKALMKAAKDKGVQVLALHVGGESRRGKTTDDLAELTVCESKQVVVVASGNKDKIFNKLADKCNVPVAEEANLAAAGDKVKSLFGE
jgi:hypothetical protein